MSLYIDDLFLVMLLRILASFFSLILVFLISINTTLALPMSKYRNKEKEAYLVIAKALYNSDVYLQFKLNTIEKLAIIEGVEKPFRLKLDYEKYAEQNSECICLDKKFLYKLKKSDSAFLTQIMSDMFNTNDKLVSYYAQIILSDIKDKESVDVYLSLSNSDDSTERYLAISKLTEFKEQKVFNMLKQKLISVKDDNEKALIIDVLGKLDNKEILPEISKYTQDKNIKLKSNSLAALINLGEDEYIEDFKVLLNSNSEDVSNHAFVLIAGLNYKINLDFLKELIKKDNNIAKISILTYINSNKDKYKNPEEIDKLINIMKIIALDESEFVKYSLAKVCMKYEDKKINTVLKILANDKEIQEKFTGLIINTDNKILIPTLIELTKSNNDSVKFEAAKKLVDYDIAKLELFKKLAQSSDEKGVRILSSFVIKDLTKSDEFIRKLYKETETEKESIKELLLLNFSDYTHDEIDTLKDILQNSESIQNRLDSAFILLNYNDKTAYKIIKNYLSTRRPVIIESQYLTQKHLSEFYTDADKCSNDWIKVNCAFNMIEYDKEKGKKYLKKILKSTDNNQIKNTIMLMFGKIGDVKDIGLLRKYYTDKYVKTKVNSACSVINIIKKDVKNK